MNKHFSLFFLLTLSLHIYSMEPVQERIRSEKMKDKSPNHSYYDIPWSFGSQERISKEYIEELNLKLSKYNLIADAHTNEAENKLIITLKAFLEESRLEPRPVHIIEMPIDNQERVNLSMDFVMHHRIDQITEHAKKLRNFLEKISVEEVKHNRSLIFKLEILPAVARNVAHNIGTQIGSTLKNILIDSYQLFRLRKLIPQDDSKLIAAVQDIEIRKANIDRHQSDLEEVNNCLLNASSEQEAIEFKKQKAALLKNYIQEKLKQTEE